MSKRILIVEDEESIADLERDYLELSGFQVEVANDGETGLNKAMKEGLVRLIRRHARREGQGFAVSGDRQSHYRREGERKARGAFFEKCDFLQASALL